MKVTKKIFTLAEVTRLLQGSPDLFVTLARNSRDIVSSEPSSKIRRELVEFVDTATTGIVVVENEPSTPSGLPSRKFTIFFEYEADLAMFLLRFSGGE